MSYLLANQLIRIERLIRTKIQDKRHTKEEKYNNDDGLETH